MTISNSLPISAERGQLEAILAAEEDLFKEATGTSFDPTDSIAAGFISLTGNMAADLHTALRTLQKALEKPLEQALNQTLQQDIARITAVEALWRKSIQKLLKKDMAFLKKLMEAFLKLLERAFEKCLAALASKTDPINNLISRV